MRRSISLIYPPGNQNIFEDDSPFAKVGYVGSPEGNSWFYRRFQSVHLIVHIEGKIFGQA